MILSLALICFHIHSSSASMSNYSKKFWSLWVSAPVCHHSLIITICCHSPAPALTEEVRSDVSISLLEKENTSKQPDIVTILVSIHVIFTVVVSWLDRCNEHVLKNNTLNSLMMCLFLDRYVIFCLH